MKKTIIITLAILSAAALAGCTGSNKPATSEPSSVTVIDTPSTGTSEDGTGTENAAATPSEIYAKIQSSYTLPDSMYEADDDWLMNYYGIDASMLSNYVFAEADEVHADRVIILEVASEDNIPEIEEKLDAVLGQLSSPEMLSYLPDQADMIKAASVKKDGNVLYLVISPDASGIEKIITDSLSGR